MTVDIYECPTGVTGVDCRVGLDKCTRDRLIADLPVVRADNSGRHGLAVAERIADRDDVFADLQVVRIAQCRHFDLILRRILDLVERDGDHRQVVAGICSFELGIAGLLVDKQNSEVVSPFHHVVVCYNEKLCVGLSDNDAGTGGFSLSCKRLTVEILDLFRKVIIDGYDRGHHLIDNPCEIRIRSFRIGDDQAGLIFDRLRIGCCGLCLLCCRVISRLLCRCVVFRLLRCRIIFCLLRCRVLTCRLRRLIGRRLLLRFFRFLLFFLILLAGYG